MFYYNRYREKKSINASIEGGFQLLLISAIFTPFVLEMVKSHEHKNIIRLIFLDLQLYSSIHSITLTNFCRSSRNDANEIDWCYNDAFVMQHDLLRDLAIYQSEQEPIEKRKRLIVDLTGNRLPEWWTKEKQPRSSARLVSISTGPPSLSLSISHNWNLIFHTVFGITSFPTF